MPRKKSEATAGPSTETEDPVVDQAEIESYDLPKSIVQRLAKNAVPKDVKLQTDVPIAMIKGSTVYVNYLAALAHDTATDQGHKTINANDVLSAIRELGWDDAGECSRMLKRELAGYRRAADAKKAGRSAPPPAAPIAKPRSPPLSHSTTKSPQAEEVEDAAIASRADDEQPYVSGEEMGEEDIEAWEEEEGMEVEVEEEERDDMGVGLEDDERRGGEEEE